ncbi:MAG: efflux RND transporter periplasmic adaptor subunit [Desulfobacteraceae bacterium]|nr:efflux RND transporter periplasmic adaptor subunit [Desulfobacteraceae bacterium]MDH3573937.1 efflux RND transporter periplasmic adaptor subunit [Desulfobacteraceae bacterium]MDH3723235.1 efflux RND transporter periplasmic adaptor subunit [Desulfobacteraceae bacterium]MDH3836776.1 efflux RND transporter periplasmic adaptor subunit [Desulfobacteraceae bacterium]MDH3876095.1 efflux RND transporter periplasmic adaptor subunit [Desulfobacteraceae bacterium]
MKTIKLILPCILLLLFFSCSQKEEQQAQAPPPQVTVVVTQAKDVPIYQEFVGQIYGFKDIAIRARVEGFLEGIHFEEGSRVEKGALLYTLESQPFEADVAAKMSRVAEANTRRAKAKSDLDRIEPLAKENAVSQSDLDSAVAQHDASIESVKAAKANLRASNIQLGYTKIYSPIFGIIGKTKAKVGDFVGLSPNPVILNTVSRIDTVLVEFFITETQYLQVARHLLSKVEPAVQNARKENLELILADGSLYDHKGKVDFVDRDVDPTTGAILVQSSFPNPQELLRPGQFAKVKALVKVVKDGILIPQRCVVELQGLYSVYVVGDGDKIQTRNVKVGPKIKQFWLITEGLKPGEHVVYEGLQRVKDGAVVNPTIKKIESTDQEST